MCSNYPEIIQNLPIAKVMKTKRLQFNLFIELNEKLIWKMCLKKIKLLADRKLLLTINTAVQFCLLALMDNASQLLVLFAA